MPVPVLVPVLVPVPVLVVEVVVVVAVARAGCAEIYCCVCRCGRRMASLVCFNGFSPKERECVVCVVCMYVRCLMSIYFGPQRQCRLDDKGITGRRRQANKAAECAIR